MIRRRFVVPSGNEELLERPFLTRGPRRCFDSSEPELFRASVFKNEGEFVAGWGSVAGSVSREGKDEGID